MAMSEMFKEIAGPLQSTAAVKSVFGDPVPAHGKTVIPVARVAYGFGGGFGKSMHEARPGEGGGGGGGVIVLPLGVFEVSENRTRFIPLKDYRKYFFWFGGLTMGVLIGTIGKRVRSKSG